MLQTLEVAKEMLSVIIMLAAIVIVSNGLVEVGHFLILYRWNATEFLFPLCMAHFTQQCLSHKRGKQSSR